MFLGNQIQLMDSVKYDRKTKTMKNYFNQNTLLSRNIAEHPTNPMANQDVEIFKINKATHRGCPLPENMYHVKKVLDPADDSVLFTASVGWISSENQMVGISACSPGWINSVDVEPFARGCGISTILTELCMIDPDINRLDQAENSIPNKALSMLINYPVDASYVKHYCKKFIGMIMVAKQASGPHAYFNAALRQGYDRMLILSGYQLHYLWVQDAKRLYQSNPSSQWQGWIGNECQGCPHCGNCIEAFKKEWFFCKDT